jgi:hypothetical protein
MDSMLPFDLGAAATTRLISMTVKNALITL